MSYAEALRIVAQDDQRVSKLDTLLGGLIFATAPFTLGASFALVDPKSEAIKLIRDLTGTAAGRIKSTVGKHHFELLEAAHTVIGLSAFFEAFTEVTGLEVTDDDRHRIVERPPAGAFGRELQSGSLPMPTPTCGFEDNLGRIENAFHRLMTTLIGFFDGLEAWERAYPGDPAKSALSTTVVAKAEDIYREQFVRFAVDIPEFGFWVQLDATSATAKKITDLASTIHSQGDSLAGLQARLTELGGFPGATSDVERKLFRRARSILDQPIWRTATPGLTFPSVQDGFISPRYRRAVMTKESEPANEDWWDGIPPSDDLAGFLTEYLVSPGSVRQPLVVLGHPGAGKTLLTEVVAARIPAESFTTVLVKLRQVDAAADPHRQIEVALEQSTRESLSWGSLVRESEKTKIVIFDGLDELIQATETTQSDYIERVTDFQRDEWADGNAVITVITSRHLVMDRVRVPEGTTLIRLEDFSEEQVRRWTATWNLANTHSPGFAPLAAETVLSKAELGRQPLLLFLLAIYAAGAGDRALADPALQGADLYSALLDSFITRQVRGKATAEISADEQRKREVALRRDLSIAAFAMFNRGRQFVTEDELSHDLKVLAPAPPTERRAGFAEPLTRAKSTVAAFFFIHVGQAREHEESSLRSYEFLHATFGEYLVAEYVARELSYLAGDWERLNVRDSLDSLDDDLLFALLSHRCLTTRQPVVRFAQRLISRDAVDSTAGMLAYLFNRARKPRNRGDVGRHAPHDVINGLATYTANLASLLIALSGSLLVRDLTTSDYWASTVQLWRAGLTEDGQLSILGSLHMDDGLVSYESETIPFFHPEISFARLSQNSGSELRSAAGDALWRGVEPADSAHLNLYTKITELQANRWPVPALDRMTPYDERAYESILDLMRRLGDSVDEIAVHILLTMLVDDAPFLDRDLTRSLVDLALDADGGAESYVLLNLAHRCPYLLTDERFADRIDSITNYPNALQFMLADTLQRNGERLFPAMGLPSRIEPLSDIIVMPEMVSRFAREQVDNKFRIGLVRALAEFGDLVWSRIAPGDLADLLERPDLDRSTITGAVNSYLAYRRSIGTPEEALTRLTVFTARPGAG
ncbi:NACHT domain-containing NTPase [Actinoplanes sp. L3-i22]|uniref:NACHT domain-containing protein n=1 Tax=Actinoplanes sp. L3-i22 TaxID=2836373 RepID=UPI001C76CF5E|nr:AAA family ATPase [Actinoplanes sp. L3-i22]BCY07420.1 hypothetical protein L3i22_025080 [Actinoplanes sp. L3-i22]